MSFFDAIWQEILNFFAINKLLDVIGNGNYRALLTTSGVIALLRSAVPALLIVELIRGLIYRRFDPHHYRVPFFTYVFNATIGRFISLGLVVVTIGLFDRYKLFTIPFTWYGFIISYVVYEFANYVHHYLGHKVRLLWCLHSIHHTSQTMNIAVAFNRFVLEQPYIDFVKTSICMLLGISVPMFLVIIVIDEIWGIFLHVSDDLLPKGRLGFLEKLVFTPSHHRVHHARNPLYMDTNFSVMLPVWDRLFKTYQPEDTSVPIEYGITRPMNVTTFY